MNINGRMKTILSIKRIIRTYTFLPRSYRNSCCGVVVITLVLHTKGLQFDPGQQHYQIFLILS